MKWILIQFYKWRMKHHYLSMWSISNSYNCGTEMLKFVSVAYAAHEIRMNHYRLKLRNLGEPV